MTDFNPDALSRFKERLLLKKVPFIMKDGDQKNLRPIETFRMDEKNNIIVSTGKIVSFFLKSVEHEKVFIPEIYFSNLHTLFDVLTRDAAGYVFESDMHISEKEIQEADNKTTIEHLTRNLIISYFDHIKTDDNKINHNLLTADLKQIIEISGSGRDYRTLVENTLKNLVTTLQENDSWRKCMVDINDAALICKLVGVQLPQVERSVLAEFIQQSRSEIKKDNDLLTKILNTRSRTIGEEKNSKQLQRMMEKLDTATDSVLNNINDYLFFAFIFIRTLAATPRSFMGETFHELNANLARLFFGSDLNPADIPDPAYHWNYSSARFRLNQLFEFEEIVTYCRSFQSMENYQDGYIHLFHLYFAELICLMGAIPRSGRNPDISGFKNCLFETRKLMGRLPLDNSHLIDDKAAIREQYLFLIKESSLENLSPLIGVREMIAFITQDDSGELSEAVKNLLVECFSKALLDLPDGAMPPGGGYKTVSRLLNGYALFCKPQRFFYQTFFRTCVVNPGDDRQPAFFHTLTGTRPRTALALFTVFSDYKSLANLLSKEQIEYSARVLSTIKEKMIGIPS